MSTPLRHQLYCSIECAVFDDACCQQLVITAHQGSLRPFLRKTYQGSRVARLALGGAVRKGEHAQLLADWLDKHQGILTVGLTPLYQRSEAHCLDVGFVNIVAHKHQMDIALVALTPEQLRLASERLRELA